MKVREAVLADAAEVSGFLQELAALGKRSLPSDAEYVRSNYISHADRIRCSVVEDEDGALLGLQILKRASEGNPYDVTPGWGIMARMCARVLRAVVWGRVLFASTLEAAQGAGLEKIDATIGASNPEGLGYYEAIGFRTYKTSETSISKCLEVSA
ncbi:GNAT family N-acetyltransferase [Pseudovibrio denitrificans]|uniref:GNAT family N-acetyltransferase n=1 Tax=Pseudovibrio denitrificans TaxID=258256 RepID=UPI000AD2349E|nr:GNAT family N-acetyltransferase [Pseudovibrio denitrificans]